MLKTSKHPLTAKWLIMLTNVEEGRLSHCRSIPKFKSLRMFDFPSYERPRISGKKKVNELKDGFLILISIIRLFIFKK